MLGNFLKIDYIVVCFIKPLNSIVFLIGNDGLSSKQVGSQASRRVTRRLAWIQPVCISINAVPALKGLRQLVSHLFLYMFCIFIIDLDLFLKIISFFFHDFYIIKFHIVD